VHTVPVEAERALDGMNIILLLLQETQQVSIRKRLFRREIEQSGAI